MYLYSVGCSCYFECLLAFVLTFCCLLCLSVCFAAFNGVGLFICLLVVLCLVAIFVYLCVVCFELILVEMVVILWFRVVWSDLLFGLLCRMLCVLLI